MILDNGWVSDTCEGGCFFFQAEDGIRDLVRSRGLGDVYKRQAHHRVEFVAMGGAQLFLGPVSQVGHRKHFQIQWLSLIHI